MVHGGNAARNTRGKESVVRPKRVLVARTVVEQQELDNFLNVTARHCLRRELGKRALAGTAISNIGSLHTTLLESRGTARDFRRKGFTPADVHKFKADLQQQLSDMEGTRQHITVQVDPERPLRWYGSILAFNILPNDALRQERQYIEDFLAERFGRVPELRPLDEHIAFGQFDRNMRSGEANRNPGLLLPECAKIPAEFALNGLAVFLDGVGEVPGVSSPVRIDRISDQEEELPYAPRRS